MSRLLSHEELDAQIQAELAGCPADVRTLYERYRIVPARLPFARPTTLDSAFVVARRGDEVIYYEEIEGGFNSSYIDAAGRIAEHWFAQDSLCAALWPWLAQTVDGVNTAIESSSVHEQVHRDTCLPAPSATSDGRRSTLGTGPIARRAVTVFHVMWLASSAGVSAIVYFSLREAGSIIRLLVAVAAFVIAILVTHVAMVYIITAWVIPRLKPDSVWNREVDAYMASIFPGQWGKPPGA